MFIWGKKCIWCSLLGILTLLVLWCRLWKSLYGLKQAPRAWFERFSTQLLHMGFQASLADSSLFVLHHGKLVVYLLIYVDDIVITGNNPKFLDSLVAQLSQAFKLKDWVPFTIFLASKSPDHPKVCSLLKPNMLRIWSSNSKCSLPNLQDLLVLLISDWCPMRALYSLIHMNIKA